MKEEQVRLFGLSQITKEEDNQMLPALDCDLSTRRDMSEQSMAVSNAEFAA
jgi:hypothetical protein